MKRIGLHRLKIYKAVYDISTAETVMLPVTNIVTRKVARYEEEHG